MPSAFYQGLAATASSLLQQFGKAVAAVRTRAVAYSDPVAGTVTYDGSTVADTACNAVRVSYNEAWHPGTTVIDGDEFYVIDTLAEVNDRLVVEGSERLVVAVWPIIPGDDFVVCRVQIR